MAKKKADYLHAAKRRQKIVFAILAVILSLGLLSSSAFWLGDSFSPSSSQQSSPASPDDVISDLQARIQANPNDAQAAANLARIYSESGSLEEAQQMYLQAVALNPDNGVLRVEQALNSFYLGDYDNAAAILSEETKRHPDNKEAYFLYGQVLAIGKKDYQNGIAALEKFIAIAKTGDEAAQARQMIEEWKNMPAAGNER